jgi:hypothetical protein
MLDIDGVCHRLHYLDGIQQHICLRPCASILDKRIGFLHQSVCDVVVSSTLPSYTERKH